MKAKGYVGEVIDVPKDFLSTTRKRIKVGEGAIDIYQYGSSFAMEKDAKGIKPDGFGYDGLLRGVRVSWVGPPHFYKRGKIIAQYIGNNDKIIFDLKDILGEQFAGQK